MRNDENSSVNSSESTRSSVGKSIGFLKGCGGGQNGDSGEKTRAGTRTRPDQNDSPAPSGVKLQPPVQPSSPDGQPSEKSTYFIQAGKGGPIKIGRASNVASRFKQIQKYSPTKLTLLGALGYDCEANLHFNFGSIRLHGEWFRATHDLVAFLATVGITATLDRSSLHFLKHSPLAKGGAK